MRAQGLSADEAEMLLDAQTPPPAPASLGQEWFEGIAALVAAGFRLDEVLDMPYAHFKRYLAAVHRNADRRAAQLLHIITAAACVPATGNTAAVDSLAKALMGAQ